MYSILDTLSLNFRVVRAFVRVSQACKNKMCNLNKPRTNSPAYKAFLTKKIWFIFQQIAKFSRVTY